MGNALPSVVMKYILMVVTSAIILSCSTGNNSSIEADRKANMPTQDTSHFLFHYSEIDTVNRAIIEDSLEENYGRIIKDLQAENMPTVNVYFYANIADLKMGVKDVEPNLPDFAIGLATSVSQIHILSPNHPDLDLQYMIGNTIHEFAHCVSYRLNPNIANNPRWLWESVAIYEANPRYDPINFPYLKFANPPSFEKLNGFDNTLVYEVGYYIAEYLVATKGKSVLSKLIINNGDIETTLGMSSEEFNNAWFQYLKANNPSIQ